MERYGFVFKKTIVVVSRSYFICMTTHDISDQLQVRLQFFFLTMRLWKMALSEKIARAETKWNAT